MILSRNKQKIEKALAAKGYNARSITWTPIGGCMEMCGPEGGWVVELDRDYVLGYNVNEVIERISDMPTNGGELNGN